MSDLTTKHQQGGWSAAVVLALALTLMLFSMAGAFAHEGAPPSVAEMISLPKRSLVHPVMDCTALAQRDFTNIPGAPATIGSASIEAAQGDHAEFCLVRGVISPQIQFELRLPTKTYTGRYLQGGCGGACGFIPSSLTPSCDDKPAFGGAFALGFENSGHVGANSIDTVWALNAPALREDFADRAAHVMSVVSKAIIAAYYGKSPAYSYFQGCSDGGREGLKEAQKYPSDFNGIVIGAPAIRISLMPLRIIWETRHGFDAQGNAVFTAESVALLHRAVLDACDALDGLKDGQIDDSRACDFDPYTLVCKPGQSENCLTKAQAEAARAYYSGPVDENGRQLYFGGEPYGAELTWSEPFAKMGGSLGANQIKFMTYDGNPPPGFDWRTWKFDASALAGLIEHGGYYDADDPDLRALHRAGGKLLIWQGAADNAAGPYVLLDYFQRVRDMVGGLKASRQFMRVFLVPGVYHCHGGYVPYEEDYLGAMVNWAEKGRAPDSVKASATLADGMLRTRPVFAYPVRAKYKGAGDINRAESFSPETPKGALNDRYDWLGANMR